jgi:hypothetical protein
MERQEQQTLAVAVAALLKVVTVEQVVQDLLQLDIQMLFH